MRREATPMAKALFSEIFNVIVAASTMMSGCYRSVQDRRECNLSLAKGGNGDGNITYSRPVFIQGFSRAKPYVFIFMRNLGTAGTSNASVGDRSGVSDSRWTRRG